MRSALACFLLGACAACGTMDSREVVQKRPPQSTKQYIDEDLQPFVNEFMRDCEARRTDCAKKMAKISSITITEIPDVDPSDTEMVIGLCHDGLFTKRIEINKAVMDKPYIYLRVLMYHEIGHCAYDLDHEEANNTIMSPVMPRFLVIVQDWNLMLADFFVSIYQKHGD
jgi:hypothetical protein